MQDADQPLDAPTEEMDVVAVRLGLAIVMGLGLLFGGLTSGGMWALMPGAPGAAQWPEPVIGVGSALVLVIAYVVIARRIGATVADWFAFGYVIALVIFGGLLMGGEIFQALRDHVEAIRIA